MKITSNNISTYLINFISLTTLVTLVTFCLFLTSCGGNNSSGSSSGSSSSSSSGGGSSNGGSSGSSSTGGSSSGTTPPLADYGDAPDGGPTGYPAPFSQTATFPSLLVSNGASIVDISAASLGATITEETDASVINDDIDDGVIGFATVLTSIPPPTTMTVNVTGTEDGAYFFNSLIDLNMDGKWGGGTGANGEGEWVVRNQAVTVTAGVITSVTSPPFAFTNGLFVPTHAWIRIALTKEQVPQDWDGSGEFSKGEIEDHVISMPIIDGKEVPMLSVNCGGPYRFNGAASIKVTCVVTNYRNVAGFFSHEVLHQPGGGSVDVKSCVTATPPNLPIGAAALPGNPANPAAAVTVICDAFKGQTRDVWTFKAIAIDPVFAATSLGFSIAHSETTSILIEFLDDDPVAANDLFLTEFDVDDNGFSGHLGGSQGCFEDAVITFLAASTPGSGGNYSETVLIAPSAMGEFNHPFIDLPTERPPGEYEVEIIDITSPNDLNCQGGGRYAPNLNGFSPPSNVLKPYASYIQSYSGEDPEHGIGSSTKQISGDLRTNGPVACLPPNISVTTTSTNNGNNFEDTQLIGPEHAVILAYEFSLEILFTLFGNYSSELNIPDVASSVSCPFGSKHDPSMDQDPNPLIFGIF